MPPPSSPLSAFSLLPALSIALGLPLCHGTHGGVVVGSPSTSADEPSADVDVDVSTSTPKSRHLLHQQSEVQANPDLAERAKNNASRIYARRVINRARLERQHPWKDDASVQPEKLNQTSSSSWKDELLSETLLSIIKLKEQITKAKSITNGGISDERFDFMDNFLSQNTKLLSQLGVNNQTNSHSNNLLFSLINNNNVAYCETNFREEYLSATASATPPSSSSSGDNSFKPAEWSDDIDLVQRRLEFGQEISPLSNTTRLQRWGMATKRILTLGMLVAPLGVMVPCNLVLGNFTGKSSSKEQEEETNPSALQNYHLSLTKRTWDYALWAIETAGPTYIKLVQWASTRNDLFSPEFVGHFSKLQDETRGHTWRETEATLVRAYGKDWRNVLSFDKVIDDDDDESDGEEGGRLKRKGGTANRERQKRLEGNETKSNNSNASGGSSSAPQPTIPIGSGCVAQVYKARLRSSYGLHPAGTSVAVKVQHPNILEKVCLDFYLMNKVASFLERIPYLNLDYLSMKDSVDQFRDIMLPQLDLRVEAHNLQRFRRDFEGETQIAFPEPLVNLTSREVLVERFVEGEPMLNFVLKEDDQHSKKDREELATIGLETVMKMIFLHDFVHADLHPGNMIVDRNKSVRGNPLRLHMIDCGLTVELGERDHMNLVKILGSLIKRDGYSAGKLMVDTAKKCQATELDVEMFCNGIEKICVDDEDNNFLESVGDYITDICYLACKHKVKLEAAFINAALACEIMEGLASSLYPGMKVQSVALPMVLKAEMIHGLKGLPSVKMPWGSSK